MSSKNQRQTYEESFRDAGLPLLISGYRPSMETFRKSSSLLGAVSMLELLILSAQGIPIVVVLLACLASGIGFAFLPRLHKLLWFSAAQTQLIVFVGLPALIAGVIAGIDSAVLVAAINLALLGVIAAGSGYGLFAIVLWTLKHLFSQLQACVGLLSKAIPLLLIFSLLIFINAELWQTIGELETGKLIAIIAVFLILGAVFIVAHIPEELDGISDGIKQKHPLRKPERVNLILVIVVGQMVQAVVVGVAVGVFFVVLGTIVVGPEVITSWTGESPSVLFNIPWLGGFTEEILKVTVFMAAFTTLYFSVAILTDDTYRGEFGREVVEELQVVFSDRDLYIDLLENDKDLDYIEDANQ